MEKLAEWVGTVLARYYPGSTPPPCWRAHQDVIINLSLIQLEWSRIYDADNPKLRDSLDFHDRWFPNAIRRVRDLTKDCVGGVCTPPT